MSDIAALVADNIDIWTGAIQRKSSAGRGRGRGGGKKISLYGIKRLRALILDLAVRGKLVPQEPIDQPAKELLLELQKLRKSSIKLTSEKIPKDKNGINEDTLPNGWQLTSLQNIVDDIHYGYTASADASLTGVRLLRITDIQDGEVDWTTVPGCQIDEDQVSKYLITDGDIMIARTGGTIGKTYLAKNVSVRAVFASYLIRAKSLEPSLSPYLQVYFGSEFYWKQLYENSAGTGQPNVNATALKSLKVPLPPLAEQKRIVAKVDALMALCEALERESEGAIVAHQTLVETLLATLANSADVADLAKNWARLESHFDTLFTTETSIDALKQTILDLAVRGKLVEQDDRDEDAGKLLDKLKAERQSLSDSSRGVSRKSRQGFSTEEQLFKLPSSWIWTRVGELTETITSGSRDWSKYLSSQGAKFVTMGNLSRGSYELRLEKMRYVQIGNDREGTRTSLQAGDLLVSITGDVGNMALIPEGFGEAYINQHTAMLRFLPSVQGRFLPELLRSPLAQKQFNEPQRGVKNSFRLSDIQNIRVPLPPLDEQHRIVAKVDALMALCDRLKLNLAGAVQTQRDIADAITQQAAS